MSYDRKELSCIIGSRVREYRMQRKMSQESLALISDVHPDFLGKLERGERCPSIDTLYKISCGLKITLSQLLDFEAGIKSDKDEAEIRISRVMKELSETEALQVAAIVEEIVKFKKSQANLLP